MPRNGLHIIESYLFSPRRFSLIFAFHFTALLLLSVFLRSKVEPTI